MTGHDRAFANARPLDDYRLPATSAEFRHWFAETVLTDAPLGSAKVRFGPDARPYERAQKTANPEYRPAMSASDVDGLIARRLAGAA